VCVSEGGGEGSKASLEKFRCCGEKFRQRVFIIGGRSMVSTNLTWTIHGLSIFVNLSTVILSC
jgi:hypothetical protein